MSPLVALLLAAACSSLAETGTGTHPAAPGFSSVRPTPASPTNGGDPLPPPRPGGGGPDEGGHDQGPGATETNFLTLPCNTDADCGGSLCILPADAGSALLGSASDAGAHDAGSTAASHLDGGGTDAGGTQAFPLGRCKPGD